MKHYKWPILSISIVLYLGAIILAKYYCASLEAIQTLSIILTGLILIWYTWETMLLRTIATSQRELDLQPFVIYKNINGQYWLENIGHGVALNIAVNTVEIGDEGYRLEILFPKKFPFLKPNECQQLNPVVKINGVEANSLNASHLNPIYANQDTEVTVVFSNSENSKYMVKETVSPYNLEINKLIKLS